MLRIGVAHPGKTAQLVSVALVPQLADDLGSNPQAGKSALKRYDFALIKP